MTSMYIMTMLNNLITLNQSQEFVQKCLCFLSYKCVVKYEEIPVTKFKELEF